MYYKDFQPINACDIDTWGFKELTLASKEYIDHLWNQPRFFERLNFMDNAKEILEIIKDEYEISIATMCFSPNGVGKEIWIHENMPYIKRLYLVDMRKYPDKSNIDMSKAVYADDNARLLRHTNAKRKILFGDTYSWNKDWAGLRCFNWYEMLAELMYDD